MAAGAAGVARSARETAPLRRTSNSARAVDSLKCRALPIYWLALLGSSPFPKLKAKSAQGGDIQRARRLTGLHKEGRRGPSRGPMSAGSALSSRRSPASSWRSRRPRMQLAVLWTLLASSSALSPGARPRTCRREALCGAAATVLSLAATPTPVFADYGQAAGQKLPAFVPSPIRPTGEMAKTCEIVALGREVAAARSKGFQREPR